MFVIIDCAKKREVIRRFSERKGELEDRMSEIPEGQDGYSEGIEDRMSEILAQQDAEVQVFRRR